MSAAAALKLAEAAGVSVAIDGRDLMLEAPAVPPAEVVDEIKANKAGIISLLTENTNLASALISGSLPSSAITEQTDDLASDGRQRADRRAVPVADTGVPQVWADRFARLARSRRPDEFDQERWQQVIDDGGRFLDRWAAEAAASGWNPDHAFGGITQARWNKYGFVGLICGGEVVMISTENTVIQLRSGTLLFYSRLLCGPPAPLSIDEVTNFAPDAGDL